MSLLVLFRSSTPATVCRAALDYDDEAVDLMRKNISGQVAPQGQMNDRTTGAPLTTSVSIFVSGDNGAQTAGGGTLAHKGNGAWSYLPTQAETNYNEIAFTYTHASGVNKTYNVYTVSYDPHNTTSLGLTNVDATISSRMASYTQPTGFLATTFPAGTVANTTNITAGTITTTTNLTNLPSITANWLTAAGIAAGALNGKGDWNIGKTDYALSTGERDSVADAFLNRDMATGTDTNARSPRNALRFLRNKWSLSGVTLTVTKEDDTATAWTATVATDAGAIPVIGNDPA